MLAITTSVVTQLILVSATSDNSEVHQVADLEKTTDPTDLDPDVLYSRVVDYQRRVATNMNDLHHELSPKVIAEKAKTSANDMVREPDGSLKTKTLVIAGGVIAAVVLVVVLQRQK